MQRLLDLMARYGERHLATPPPGAVLLVIAVALGLAGLALSVYGLAGLRGAPPASSGLLALAVAALILQTASLQLAHRRVLSRLRGAR